MESKEIILSTYQPKSGGFGVYVSKLSGEILSLFSSQLGLTPDIQSVNTRSERLKRFNTLSGAEIYIQRFYSLSKQDQVNKISNKSIKLATKTNKPTKVVTGIQFYRLSINGKKIGSFYRLDEIATLRKTWPQLSVEKTVVKQMMFDKEEFELFKHCLTCVAITPKNGDKRDIVTQFKGIYTKRNKK